MNRVSSLQDVLLLILFIHFTFKKVFIKKILFWEVLFLLNFITALVLLDFLFFVLNFQHFHFPLLKFYPLYIELNKTLNKLEFSADSWVGWNCFWSGFLEDGMYSLIGWLDQTPDLWRFSDWFLKITIFDLECVRTSWSHVYHVFISLDLNLRYWIYIFKSWHCVIIPWKMPTIPILPLCTKYQSNSGLPEPL